VRPRAARALLVAAACGLGAGASPAAEPEAEPAPTAAPAQADQAGEASWKGEFADVCSRTQDAMSLASAELAALVARCDALRPRVEELPGPQRKVYLRRLQVCRDLYQFVLDARAAGTAK